MLFRHPKKLLSKEEEFTHIAEIFVPLLVGKKPRVQETPGIDRSEIKKIYSNLKIIWGYIRLKT